MGKTEEYWDTFSDEKTKQNGTIEAMDQKCRGDIATLIKVINHQIKKYNIFTNNCRHFAEEILVVMKYPNRT